MEIKKLRDIYYYLLLHGHQDLEIFEVDSKVYDLVKAIDALPVPEFQGIEIPYISNGLLVSNARFFLESKLFMHYVGYLSNERLIKAVQDKRVVDVASLVDLYNRSASFVPPHKIPISYTEKGVFKGSLETQLLIFDDKEIDREVLSKINVFFNQIKLSMHSTDIGTSCYIHELVHTQLESCKGVINNYYNSEVASIFMEMLYALENDRVNFQIILSSRISHIISCFNRMATYQTGEKQKNYELYDFCKDGKYFISILKAFNLLRLYMESDKPVKKEILKSLQHVFDGEDLFESFLDKFDISYESSLELEHTKKLLLSRM